MTTTEPSYPSAEPVPLRPPAAELPLAPLADLRSLDKLTLAARLTIRQGEYLGRPSLLTVDIAQRGSITVSGTVAAITGHK